MRKESKNKSKRSRNNRPRTSGYKGKPMDKETVDKEAVAKSENDPAWYASDPVLLKDAASYPFSYVTGATDIHDATVYDSNYVELTPYDQVSGVATLHVYPCVGTVTEATDPINVAAQSIYSFVRHANSGHPNYDPCDLMIYIMAMANMYSGLVWCQRLYGYALTYDQRNRYIPDELIRTNNVDAADLRNNLANFRFWLNTLIAKMASFAVPASMSVFSRMTFMFSDYYIEGTSIKEQLYQFAPEGFYQFGLDSDQKGELQWKPFDYTTIMSTQDVMTYFDQMFDAIWSQEDFGIMSGDILKAYQGNIIKLTSIPEYYVMTPKFDTVVLTQMKNADLVRIDPTNISQDPNRGLIVQTIAPKVYTASDKFMDGASMSSTSATSANAAITGIYKDYKVLTVDTDDPTPEIVIEATRLKVAYDGANSVFHVGTEMVTRVVMSIAPNSEIIIDPIQVGYDDQNTLDCTTIMQNMIAATRMFHYMPQANIVWYHGSNTKMRIHTFFDIDNFTVLTYQDVKKLHEAAVINMFEIGRAHV